MLDPAPAQASTAHRGWRTFADAARRADVILSLAGLGFGAVSLFFPFGRDQGLYYYVGREWLQRGAMPYRDVFEQKTPAIFALHALAIAVFGDHLASIRLLELGCVAALGLVCARLASPVDARPAPGLRGTGVLCAMVLYFGFFNFWDTAQCEIWCTTAAMASACAAVHMRRDLRAALVAGLLGGLALVCKPPGAPLVALAGILLVRRALRTPRRPLSHSAAMTASFLGGLAVPTLLVVGYFASRGALPAMLDVLVGANRYYFDHERGVHSAFEVAQRSLDVYKLWEPVSALLLEASIVALVIAVVRQDRTLRERHAFALVACAAGFLGVLSQLKFYMYHWGLVVGPATLVAVNVAMDVSALVRWRMPGRAPTLGLAIFAVNLIVAYGLSGRAANMWLEEATAAAGWVTGGMDRAQFADSFRIESLGYCFGADDRVGLWLRNHTSADDEVAVRGFEPAIYAVAGRHFGGRFFWTTFLTDPRRAYHRDEWLAEDRRRFVEHPPRWVVASGWEHQGPDAPEYFESLGYVRRETIDEFAIMEKSDRAAER